MTLVVVPSELLPRNLLLLADSAVPPAMALVLLKKSLFDRRMVPPAMFAAVPLLANVLSETLTWQPLLARTAPLAPVVLAKKQLRAVTKALEVVLIPPSSVLKRQLSICAVAKPELVLTRMAVPTLSKKQSSTLSEVEVAAEA